MRFVTKQERAKRGCLWCIDKTAKGDRIRCPYEKCPYTELNQYSSYDSYMEKLDAVVKEEMFRRSNMPI